MYHNPTPLSVFRAKELQVCLRCWATVRCTWRWRGHCSLHLLAGYVGPTSEPTTGVTSRAVFKLWPALMTATYVMHASVDDRTPTVQEHLTGLCAHARRCVFWSSDTYRPTEVPLAPSTFHIAAFPRHCESQCPRRCMVTCRHQT